MADARGTFATARWRARLHWFLLGLMALLMLVPLEMVESVVRERHSTYRGVLREVAGLWGGEQVLTGPLLAVPFTEKFQEEEELLTKDGWRGVYHRDRSEEKVALLLPRELDMEGEIEPSERRRGIYTAKVYTGRLHLSGYFDELESTLAGLSRDERQVEVHWDKSVIVFGLTEPKGIVRLESSTPVLRFEPGTQHGALLPAGIHAGLPVEGDRVDFSLDLTIRGSGGLRWAPVGERSRASMSSPWTHPSFYGEVVPATYEISESGFEAEWDLSQLVRNYPQSWLAGTAVDLGEVTTGVRLFEPVALYSRVTRSVKYGLLFILLTFLSLGLVELVSGARIGLVQYLLIGLALALFFLILIALAEHLGFALAYLIAAATVVILNSSYCLAFLPRRSMAVAVALVLGSLYGVLYAILRAEDYALLSGTALLVAALATTMYLTRRMGRDPQSTGSGQLSESPVPSA